MAAREIYWHLPGFCYFRLLNQVVINLMKDYPDAFREGYRIGSVYGAFPGAIWNGGRVVFGITGKSEIESVLQIYNKRGIPVRFTWTNSLLEEKHLQDTYCNLIMRLADNGLNQVLVNTPVLEEYIRREYPRFPVISSTTKRITEWGGLLGELEKDYFLVVLDYDLNFLYGIRERVPLQGNGPRAMALTNEKLVVPTYFADVLNVMDINTREVTSTELNPGRTESNINKGEKYFNDASHCFQNWQSCNGCHPGEARTDGMNWDLMNDGVGNSKNCKSLLFSHVTPPNMISGIRASAEVAVRAGYNFIQFFDITEDDAKCVDEYLTSLRPVPSPLLVNGELSDKAKEGRKVFEKLKCGECHSGPYYTDMKMHRIGEDIEFEKGWDTPTLREVWRTAPYLFDGRAATMEEVFEVHKHGIDKKVSKKDIEALVEYVNSL